MPNNIQDMPCQASATGRDRPRLAQRRLAEGAAHLAAQVSGGTVTIIAAGGTDDGGLGTSAAKVERAVRRADGGAGVVVLPDLGSAVLTVRAMLDDLPT